MDIETDRIPLKASPTTSGPHVMDADLRAGNDSRTVSPVAESCRLTLCMPSARAIADAIIRRTLSDGGL
jgi:hypothetical protein